MSLIDYVGRGLASDKVEDFNKYQDGVRVMGPSIYGSGNNKGNVNFIVGFPYLQPMHTEKNIILSEKYLLFTPWEDGKENVFRGQGSQTGAVFSQPYDFRLIAIDNLTQIGIQSLLWILGFNNAAAAKKQFLKLDANVVITQLKRGLESLSKSSNIANDNKSGKIIFDGYNALISSPDAHLMIFNNFVDGHKKIDKDYLKANLPLKTA